MDGIDFHKFFLLYICEVLTRNKIFNDGVYFVSGLPLWIAILYNYFVATVVIDVIQ